VVVEVLELIEVEVVDVEVEVVDVEVEVVDVEVATALL
jgi:hypothetical protein